MYKSNQLFLCFIMALILFCLASACSISQPVLGDTVSTQNSAEMQSNTIPQEAMEKVRHLLAEIEGEHELILLDEVDEILQFDTDVFVVISRWLSGKSRVYLPILVSRNNTKWNALFLGENTVEFTSTGINVIETGTLGTIEFQGTAVKQGFLFYVPGRYMRVMLNAELMTDNRGTEQQSFDLKKTDGDGDALWLFAVHNPERPGSVMLLANGVFSDEDQNDLVFLYVKNLNKDYELICGDIIVNGSDLLNALGQSGQE